MKQNQLQETKDIEIQEIEADMDETETDTAETETDVNETEAEDAGENRRFHVNIHLVILCVIVALVGFSAYRLYVWNKGVPSDYDPNYQTTDFDIEVMDSIIPLAPDKLEGHVDDGVTTILCLGDDPFSLNQGEGGLAEQIAAKTGATVYNGSFTGSTIALQNLTWQPWNNMDAFAFVSVTQSLASGDFDVMKEAADYSYDEAVPSTVEMLASLDMNSVDVLCVMYDGSDYINMRISDDPNAPYNTLSYTGALRSGIESIQESYPHIRIVIMSHTFCHSINEEGNFENGDRADLGHGTLSHYWQKELDVTMDCGVSFIDNFYGSVNEDNYLDYMTDYIHFNDAGRELLADRFVQCIFPKLTNEG